MVNRRFVFECLELIDLAYRQGKTIDGEGGTQVEIDHAARLVAFPGTQPDPQQPERPKRRWWQTADWRRNLDRSLVDPLECNGQPIGIPGRVHCGYWQAALKAADYLKQQEAVGYSLTGHSLGGALACLTAAILVARSESRWYPQVVDFGSPRHCDARFRWWCESRIERLRFTAWGDPVPWVPGAIRGNRHWGANIRLGQLGSVGLAFLTAVFSGDPAAVPQHQTGHYRVWLARRRSCDAF